MMALLLAACSSAEAGGPPVTVETGIDPDAWALVPAGEFLMGQFEERTPLITTMRSWCTRDQRAVRRILNAALADETNHFNDEKTEILGFYPGDEFHAPARGRIDAGDWLLYPVTEEGVRLDFDGETFAPKAGYENHPATFVTWFGARAYCEYYEGRLPSGAEWEKPRAARRMLVRTRGASRSSAITRTSTPAATPSRKAWGDRATRRRLATTTARRMGDYETLDSPSPYGVYDMGGNVWQWTATCTTSSTIATCAAGAKANTNIFCACG